MSRGTNHGACGGSSERFGSGAAVPVVHGRDRGTALSDDLASGQRTRPRPGLGHGVVCPALGGASTGPLQRWGSAGSGRSAAPEWSELLRPAFRQTEGLIGSIIGLLGLTLRVPDHTTLSRRAATSEVPRPQRHPSTHAEALHLLVDRTGLKLCAAGDWLVEKHGTRTRRSWRKLHLGVDADT